jgi:rubrerythrin
MTEIDYLRIAPHRKPKDRTAELVETNHGPYKTLTCSKCGYGVSLSAIKPSVCPRCFRTFVRRD